MPASRPRPQGRDASPGLRLLDAIPAMQEAVPPGERALARRALLAPVGTFDAGSLTVPAPTDAGHPFAIVIVSGLVLRRTHLGGRAVGELLGAFDVIDTEPDEDLSSLPARTEHLVHARTTIAILDDRFRVAARRWPELHRVVGAQQARQARRASRHLAALGLSRVEDRVIALFCELADRWGRVTPDGIRVDVPLTHTVIGELVGARRPTVSLAMAELAAAGTLTRGADRSWLLVREAAVAA